MQDVLIYLLKSSALIGLFYFAYFILLKQETSFMQNRKFLLVGLVSSLVLPFIYFTQKEYIEAQGSNAPYIAFTEFTPQENLPIEAPIDWWQIGFYVYLLGIAIMAFKFLFQLYSLQRIINSGKQKRFKTLKLVRTSKNIKPFSFFKHIVFNPEKHNEKDLKLILKHEQIHAKQWHSLDVIFTSLLCVVFWFNPFIWLYKKVVVQNLEFLADQDAVANIPSKKEYQKALVMATVGLQPAMSNQFYQSFIKKRIIMLNKSKKKNTPWKTLLIIPFLCLFLYSFNLKTETITLSNEIKTEQNTPEILYSARISKNTTQEEFENYSKEFKKVGATLNIENLSFNNENEIKRIRISLKSQFGRSTKETTNIGEDKYVANLYEDGNVQIINENEPNTIGNKKSFQDKKLSKVIINDTEYLPKDLSNTYLNFSESLLQIDDSEKTILEVRKGQIVSDIKSFIKENANKKRLMQFIFFDEKSMAHVFSVDTEGKTFTIGEHQETTTFPGISNIKFLKKDPMVVVNESKGHLSDLIVYAPVAKSITALESEKAIALYGEKAKNGALVIKTSTSGNQEKKSKKINRIICFSTPNLKDTIHLLNGQPTSEKTLKNLKNEEIKEVLYVPGNTELEALYGARAKNGMKIIITNEKGESYKRSISNFIDKPIKSNSLDKESEKTKNDNKSQQSQESLDTLKTAVRIRNIYNQQGRPLYVLNGEVISIKEFEKIVPADIKALYVLKNKSAATKYKGQHTENGVVEIYTNDYKGDIPIQTTSKVFVYTINPYETDAAINGMIKKIKKAYDVDVDIKKLHRNDEGLIDNIKMKARQSGSSSRNVTYSASNSNDHVETIYMIMDTENDDFKITNQTPGK